MTAKAANPFASMGVDVETSRRMDIMHPGTNMPLRVNLPGAKPDAGPTIAYIELFSKSSKIGRKADKEVTNGRLKLRNRNQLTADRLEEESTDLLARLTTGWLLAGLDGAPVENYPCNYENALVLYRASDMKWLRDQVDAFVVDDANFLPTSSQTSSTSQSTNSA